MIDTSLFGELQVSAVERAAEGPFAAVAIGVQLIHGLTVLVIHVAPPIFLNQRAGDRYRNSMQGLYTMAFAGAGRVIGWGYGVVRFVWFGAFLALVGMVALRAWVWTPAVRATGLGDSEAAVQFRRRFARALPLVWVALVVAGGLELVFQTASVSGLSLVSSAHPHVLAQSNPER